MTGLIWTLQCLLGDGLGNSADRFVLQGADVSVAEGLRNIYFAVCRTST